MKAVLVTGARGYLGARIAALYASAGRRVVAWTGDLRGEAPFAHIDPADIGVIVHAAAVTRFNVEPELARTVNVEGTVKLLRFAERCRGLETLGLLSSIYASGLQAGAIDERPFDGADGFANHYERSKWEAESELVIRFAHLPWRIFRLATVIADDASGAATRHNAVHNTLKLLYHGLISLVPGEPDTPLYFITGDFAAGNVVELMERGAEHVIYHLAHDAAHSLTLGALLDTAWQAFGEVPAFARRRLLRPAYAGLGAFRELADGMSGLGGHALAQAIGSVTPFAPQLYVKKAVRTRNLQLAATRWTLPDARALARSACLELLSR